MADHIELILVFLAVIIGVVTAAYFYISAGAFGHLNLLRDSLKLISSGMFIIAIGVLIGAFISFEAKQGFDLFFYDIPLQAFFYLLYIIGSVLILFGARKFTARPTQEVVDVSLRGR